MPEPDAGSVSQDTALGKNARAEADGDGAAGARGRASAAVRLRHPATGDRFCALRYGAEVRLDGADQAKRARTGADGRPAGAFEDEKEAQAWLEARAEALKAGGYVPDLGLGVRDAPAWAAAKAPVPGPVTFEIAGDDADEVDEVFPDGCSNLPWAEFRAGLASLGGVAAEKLDAAEAALAHGQVLVAGEYRGYGVFFAVQHADGHFGVVRAMLEDGAGVPFHMSHAESHDEEREQTEQLVDPTRMWAGKVADRVAAAAAAVLLRPGSYNPQPDDCMFEWELCEVDPATFPSGHVAVLRDGGDVCWAKEECEGPEGYEGNWNELLAQYRQWYDAWAAAE